MTRVRHAIFQPQAKKPHEGESVTKLVLNAVVQWIMQLLQYQHLEHQYHIKRLRPSIALAPFLMHAKKIGAKPFPINQCVQA